MQVTWLLDWSFLTRQKQWKIGSYFPRAHHWLLLCIKAWDYIFTLISITFFSLLQGSNQIYLQLYGLANLPFSIELENSSPLLKSLEGGLTCSRYNFSFSVLLGRIVFFFFFSCRYLYILLYRKQNFRFICFLLEKKNLHWEIIKCNNLGAY